MEPKSFSLVILNLFVGLMRGHRFLAPTSRHLTDSGYRLWRVEPRIFSRDKVANPDAAACSTVHSNTLVAEWTHQARPDEGKQQQIRRYCLLSPEDLAGAGVPVDATDQVDRWLIVAPEAVAEYVRFARDDGLDLLISSFGASADSPYVLHPEVGRLKERKLAETIGTTLSFERVPLGYLRFSLDDLSHEGIAEHILPQLVSFCRKGSGRFTSEHLCAQAIRIWRVLEPSRRDSVARVATRLLSRLKSRKDAGRWLRRVADSPPTWEITVPGESPAAVLGMVRRSLDRFVAELKGEPVQEELPFDSD